jgi:hypothetical protein
MKQKKAHISAHHNVEDFRPYNIHFKDKGDAKQNLIQGLMLAIKRESEWHGWFEEYSELEGTTLAAIRKAIEDTIANGGVEINLPTYDRVDESAEVVPREDGYVFAIWFVPDGQYGLNCGFGFGTLDAKGKAYTDKYENKWVEIL